MHVVQSGHANAVSTTVYGSRAAAAGIPRFEMGEEEMDPRLAKRFCQDELLMNGNPHLNLARCVALLSSPTLARLAQTRWRWTALVRRCSLCGEAKLTEHHCLQLCHDLHGTRGSRTHELRESGSLLALPSRCAQESCDSHPADL